MSATDCRTGNFYRLPIYQKRVLGIENHPSNSHTRSPSPNRSVFASRRRHSTPPVPTKHLADVNSSPANTLIKYYHSYPRRGCVNNEQNSGLESSKSPSRPMPFVKLRYQEERGVRLVTTPTSVKSFTDIVLPIAKKNRNAIVETSNSSPSEIQSITHSVSSMRRGKGNSSNVEHEVFLSNEDSHDKSLEDNTSQIKWCHTKCPCRFTHCNLCHWYCSCPFCCWILCFLFAFALLTGLFLSLRFLSH